MADITSSTYPVVTDSKDGDQYAIVRNGQLKKQTRSGLDEHIESIAATDFLGLSDTPGTYLGQVGKVPQVNVTEDGLDFVPSGLAPTYLILPDTPSSYAAQAGKRPAVNGGETALEFTDTTFIESSDTPATYSGLGGSLLRVNAGETGLEFFPNTGEIPNVVLVDSEADLPAVNGSGEHELLAGTAYWFTTSMALANPIRFMGTDTEVYGNGIGETVVTYTGTGYAIRATNGSASIRLRYLQFVSATGDGFEFVGGGSGSGTNVSIDRAYIIAPSGEIGKMTSVDIFFAEAAVFLGSQGLSCFGSDNDLFYCGTSRFQANFINQSDRLRHFSLADHYNHCD